MGEKRLELLQVAPHDPKSCASTNSAIRPRQQIIQLQKELCF